MKLILIRHAIACERSRDRWPRDADRPLSQRGIRRYRQAARGLGRLRLEPYLLLASPFLRTHQTAGILEDELGWPAPEMRGEFAVGAELGSAIELLGGCAPHTTVAVVVGLASRQRRPDRVSGLADGQCWNPALVPAAASVTRSQLSRPW